MCLSNAFLVVPQDNFMRRLSEENINGLIKKSSISIAMRDFYA